MNVLVLHSRYLSGHVSGENRVVDDELRLLREAGHDVRLFDPSPTELRGSGLLRTGRGAVWSARAAREVRRLIGTHRPDVAHVHNLFPMLSPSVIRAAAGAGVPVVMTLHNYRLLCLPANLFRDGHPCEDCVGRVPWPGVVHRCYRDSYAGSVVLATSLTVHRSLRTFDAVSRFVAVSAFVRDRHVAAGVDPQRIVVKPHFTWTSPRREGPGDYFLYLGRLSAEKGVVDLVSLWRPALGRLLVVGDGPQTAAVRRAAGAAVEMLGEVPPQQVPALLSNARALLVPSRSYETFSRSAVEALAAGVPVVASRIGGIPDVVEDDVSGRLVDPLDPAAWSDAIASIDDETSMRLGDGACRRWRERFSPDVALRQLLDIYGGARRG